MKSVFLSTILSLVLSSAIYAQSLAPATSSQPIKGDYMVGGSLGFNLISTPNFGSNYRNLNLSIAPNFGKFISEKYLISGGVGYSYSDNSGGTKNFDFKRSTSNAIDLTFGITRFYSITDNLFFTLRGYVGTGYESERNVNEFIDIKNTYHNDYINGTIGISPGLSYFLNNRWMINASMGALNYKLSHANGFNIHTFNANFSVNSFRIGVNYIFKGKGN